MRFVSFLAGLILFVCPLAYLTVVWAMIDQIWRATTWEHMSEVMVATRWLGLPIWLACAMCAALGAWLMWLGQNRPEAPQQRRRAPQTQRYMRLGQPAQHQ